MLLVVVVHVGQERAGKRQGKARHSRDSPLFVVEKEPVRMTLTLECVSLSVSSGFALMKIVRGEARKRGSPGQSIG